MSDGLSTFMGITGCSDEETAKFYLESSKNDVEQAINMYMESGGQPLVESKVDDEPQPGNGNPDASFSFGMAESTGRDKDEQRWYTGGPAGGSGQEVIAPGDNGDGKKNQAFEDVRQAVEPHARQGTSQDLEEESDVFTGAARTLDGQIRQAPKKKKKMVIKFYPNGVFTVDDGPPRSVDDAANQAFLEAIKERRVPDELAAEFQDGLDLSIMPMTEDYDPASAPRPAFTGKGNKLGSSSASTSSAPAQPVETWTGPNDSEPVTSIQIRLPDGSRLIGRFNHSQKIREIRAFVAAARPGFQVPASMVAGFPPKPIEDENISIEEGGLVSGVVFFK